MTARAGRWLIVLTVTAGIGLFSATGGHAQDDEAGENKGQSRGNEFDAWREFDDPRCGGSGLRPFR